MALGDERLMRFQFNDIQAYLLVFTDENLAIYKDGSLVANVVSPYTSSQLSTLNYTQKDDIAVFVHEDVEPYKLSRMGFDYAWSLLPIYTTSDPLIPYYGYSTTFSSPATTLTPSGTNGIVTLTAGAASFTAGSVNQYVIGNGGRARIVGYTSTTIVTASVEIPFLTTVAIPSGSWDYETGYEALWSSTQGYPRAVTFHLQRLVFGGMKNAPSVIAASSLSNIYDFALGTNSDADGFYFEIASDKADVIYHLNSHEDLEIFTSSSEYIVDSASAFTPSGFKVKRQTSDGSKPGIIPEEYQEGGTLFVQKDGSSILEFNFSDTINSYRNERIDVFSPHLTVNPVDATLRPNTTNQQASYWLQINSTGELISIALLKSQEVVAATRNTTDGLFTHIVTVGSNMYAVVERTINAVTVRYLEELSFSNYTDSAISMTVGDARISGTTVSGLDHLEAKSIWTIIDSSVYGPVTVSGGSVTIATAVTSTLEVGLDYVPVLITNPVEDPQNAPPLMGNTKSIYEINTQLYNTQEISIQGYNPFKQVLSSSSATSTIDSYPTGALHSGRFRMTGFIGWDELGQVTVTQNYPVPATLLNIAIYFIYGK